MANPVVAIVGRPNVGKSTVLIELPVKEFQSLKILQE